MAKLKPNQFYLPSGALITELPILMKTDMVQANLEDQKSMTRRMKGLSLNVEGKPKKDWIYTECFLGSDLVGNDAWMAMAKHVPTGGTYSDNCPYGKPGDLLWVKEKFTPLGFDMFNQRTGLHYSYFADCDLESLEIAKEYGFKWKPSLHLPKEASRIWLMVEFIRVERLQDITEEDALAEGVLEYEDGHFKNYFTRKGLRTEDGVEILLAKGSFQSLICTINGMEIWDKNPWVWVIKYRILSKTGRPSLNMIEKNYLEVTSSPSGEAGWGRKEVANG